MFSGRNHTEKYYTGFVHSDRLPKDTPMELHLAIDQTFNDIFGWRARSHSIFVTGRKLQASNYGNVYVILPIGNYRYVWNPSVYDFQANKIGTFTTWAINKIMRYDSPWKKDIDDLGAKLYKNGINVRKSQTLESYLRYARHAIAKKYLNDHKKDFHKLYESLLISLVKGYKDKELDNATKSGVEIMLECSSNRYLAIAVRQENIIPLWFKNRDLKTAPTRNNVLKWAEEFKIDDSLFGLKLFSGQ